MGDVHESVPAGVGVVHVMDSEGDAYDLLEYMAFIEADFVVRLRHDRRVVTEVGSGRLSEPLPKAALRLIRSVPLSMRRGRTKTGRHAARDERLAHLEVRVLDVELVRPAASHAQRAQLALHVVHVVEPAPPAGEEPVAWTLATTLPVDTAAAAEAVVDAYRARWLIEEWFKSLETGCAYQTRRIESLDALLIAFGMMAPIATRLLAIRWAGRNQPERPAAEILDQDELDCLRIMECKRGRALPKNPATGQAMLAIARLGGFLTQNRVPGWQVLGRGFEKLSVKVEFLRAMRDGPEEM